MMTPHLKRLGLTCLLSLAPVASQAHGVWLEMQHGELAVVYGHGGEEDAYDPAKLTSIAICPMSIKTDAAVSRGVMTILATVFAMALADAVMKLSSGGMSLWQI